MGARGEKTQQAILSLLRHRKEPASAYDMLGKMREQDPKLAPMTIYRALSVLVAAGKVHRLESLNAYILCQNKDPQPPVLAICDDCGSVAQSSAPEVLDGISKIMGTAGFEPNRHVIEVHGTCSTCSSQQDTA